MGICQILQYASIKFLMDKPYLKPYKKQLKPHNRLTTVQFGLEHVLVSEFDEVCVDHNLLEFSIF